jgi:hypothetical protein
LSSAPTRDAGLDQLLADPALCSTAKAVAVALIRHWAWRGKDHCWPSDATIAAKVGRSPGHVQRCLRRLERAGWIERERTDEVPNGRRIWLRWRKPGAGAQPDSALARIENPAPARDEQVVIVNERTESEEEPSLERSRPEPEAPFSTAQDAIKAPVRAGSIPAPALPLPSPVQGVPGPGVEPLTAGVEEPVGPGPRSPQPADNSPHLPCPVATPPRPGRRSGLSVAALAAAVASTADPILARELARLTAPADPADPDPRVLSTPDLLTRLPGRHDLVMAAARRMCVETGDEKPATQRTFESMARAIACRVVPTEILARCLKQALGPMARERGKVLVAAWKREAGRSPGDASHDMAARASVMT